MNIESAKNIFKKHQSWLIPLLILIISFTVRLSYLNQLEKIPTFNYPVMDEKYHVAQAEKINSGEGLGTDPFYRAPLYQYWFAFLYEKSGGSLYWPRLVQIAMGSFLPLLILLLGVRLFNRKIAVISAFIAALYPTFIYFDSTLLITSLMTLLTTLLVWQLLRTEIKPTYTNFIIAGLLLGIAGLARPNILLLGPFLFIWAWLVIKPKLGTKQTLLRYVLIGAASLIVIAPVTIRNYKVADDFVFIAWQGGFNFFLGNNSSASGWSATVPGIDFSWEGGYNEAIAIAEQSEGRELKRSEVSSFWYGIAFKEIGKDPGNFVSLAFKKLRLFFNGYEIPNNQDIYFTLKYTPTLSTYMFAKGIYFPYGLVSALALLGLFYSMKNWRSHLILYLVIGAYLTTLILFFVCARFRMPLMPLMILMAVSGGAQLFASVRTGRLKQYLLPVFVFALLLFETNHDMLKLDHDTLQAESHLNMGLAHMERNVLSQAAKEFRLAIKSDPEFAPAYNNMGIVATRQGKLAQATGHFQNALDYDSSNPARYFNLANNFADRRDFSSVVKLMERANKVIPGNAVVMARLGQAYYEAGQYNEALAMVEQTLKLNPNNRLAIKVYQALQSASNSENSP